MLHHNLCNGRRVVHPIAHVRPVFVDDSAREQSPFGVDKVLFSRETPLKV
jgi:hypothetical protein